MYQNKFTIKEKDNKINCIKFATYKEILLNTGY